MSTGREERVRTRAYVIWEAEGRPDGRAERHWTQAEAELRDETDLPPMPGDAAAPGTPGTGEDVCRVCGGTGQLQGQPCPSCGGTGKVVEGIGGG